jgi:hypothetical protein
MTHNPYRSLPEFHFWRKSVSAVERHQLDPVVRPKFSISRSDRVATAGSCFAQHISRRLQAIDFNYFIAEDDASLGAEERKRRNYGVFSARYGNIYTTRQLLQLFQQAFDGRTAADIAWRRPDGRYADPFRPNIEPDGFASIEAVIEAREAHLEAVRNMFLGADVFVFTLGLTEGWAAKADGSVFPLAPGVVAGSFSADAYEPINLSVYDVEMEMFDFLARVKAINEKLRVLLTVSPVPLIATHTDRHVLSATTYSKSVLRVAAETLSRGSDWIDYFPSYEIITGSYSRGVYYEDDAREVNELGVSHAMRCFFNNYVGKDPGDSRGAPRVSATDAPPVVAAANGQPAVVPGADSDLVCDEESIDQINR